jgi:AcrR family transcriptional regulator
MPGHDLRNEGVVRSAAVIAPGSATGKLAAGGPTTGGPATGGPATGGTEPRSPQALPPMLMPGELGRPVLDEARKPRAAEIIGAARRILEAGGPETLTMRRVADELGIQAPSLYKHFASKAELELALVTDAMAEIGEASHDAVRLGGEQPALAALLETYRRYSLGHPHLYRLATGGPLARHGLPSGLEEWAGNPWYVVTLDPYLAQALWSFAHGMVILELDGRYPPGSDLDAAWAAGALAFEGLAAQRRAIAHTEEADH